MIFKKEVINLGKISSLVTSMAAMATELPGFKKIVKRIIGKLIEHRLAVKLLSQDENLKKLTNVILKRGDIIFQLMPIGNKREIAWQVKPWYIKEGSIKKILYYNLSMIYNPSVPSIIPYDKNEQLVFLAHEFLHIILDHHSKIGKSCGLCPKNCLKQELEADVAINGVLKMVDLRVILDKAYWKNRIALIMKQCQEENQGQKCLRIILDGKCPETKSIKLYLKMIALDAENGSLSKQGKEVG